MKYIENPKTKGSGIICAIPQTGTCPNNCEDCFFQSGRSYLEPLAENLPNLPPREMVHGRIVRVNDGNDSNIQKDIVMETCKQFPRKFYNTALPNNLESFDAPVVLTLNPGVMTDEKFHLLNDIPAKLMFVRFRTNTWNINVAENAVEFYTSAGVPVILTFMAYFRQTIPEDHQQFYTWRKRTLNSYWAITTAGWQMVMQRFFYNKWVYSCGKIEGENGTTACRHCGNCLREYFATMERLAL